MKRIAVTSVLILLACLGSFAQGIPAYTADALMKRASSKDTIYVINFWATWCVPCVKELPAFDSLQARYPGRPVKIILVSFDFKESYPEKITAFVKKKKLQPEVAWFSETNANDFIPKIDSTWSGSLPATLVLSPSKKFRWFNEGSVTAVKLTGIIDKELGL